MSRNYPSLLATVAVVTLVVGLNGSILMGVFCCNQSAVMLVRYLTASTPDTSQFLGLEQRLSALLQKQAMISRIYRLLAIALAGSGHREEAVALLEARTADGKSDLMARYTLATLLEEVGRHQDALEVWRQLSPIERSWTTKGEEAFKAGDLQGARSWFHRALEVAPDSALAHLGLGQVYESRELWEEALEQYRTALENDGRRDKLTNSQRIRAYWGAGTSLYRMGRASEAAAYLSQATDAAPFEPSYHRFLAYALMQAGDCQRALTEFLKTEHLDSRLGRIGAGIYVDIGEAHACLGNIEAATAAWRHALELEPDNKPARDRLRKLGLSAP